MISIKKCICCGKEFETKSSKKIYCSTNCAKVIYSKQKFPDGSDYVECKICGFRSNQIYRHIETVHKLTVDDYKQHFNCGDNEIISEKSHERMSSAQKELIKNGTSHCFSSGENNPAKSKDMRSGRNSIWSLNFHGYDGMTLEEKQNIISERIRKSRENMQKRNNNPLKISYYLARGYTEQEAGDLLKIRQDTITLQKYIEIYGEKNGKYIYEHVVERRKRDLERKGYDANVFKRYCSYNKPKFSKVSQQLFNKITERLTKHYEEIYYATNRKGKYNNEYAVINEEQDTYYLLDFYIKDINKVIEFDGDFWHKNQEERDAFRESELKRLGYTEILRIKEKDYIENPEKEILKCLKFLEG